ncbi:hypothetical protein AB1K70_11455 [Bremerella sp. JC770]|uniref:hypothetical protein n=1 Tax=Bremerella sp. JC770 TaxID=3232137 RepID=UPI00345777A6
MRTANPNQAAWAWFLRSRKTFTAGVLLLAATAACIGCSDENDRNRVSGSVTLDGQPVPNGLITFEPDHKKGHTGPQGIARIVDGQYDTSATGGRGVVSGPHRVRIDGYRGEAADAQANDPSDPNNVEVLLQGYETDVDLLSEDTKFDFSITSDELSRARKK